jgi:hypothetical protein
MAIEKECYCADLDGEYKCSICQKEEEKKTNDKIQKQKSEIEKNLPQIPKEQILKYRAYWYQRVFCTMECVKNLHNKETAFLTNKGETEGFLNVRYLYASSYDMFQKHITELDFLNRNINVYRSVATMSPNSIPVSSYNLIRRVEEPAYQEFSKNYKSYVENYDMIFDIDFKGYENISQAYYDVKKIKDLFEEFKLPYGIWNTSFKGVHFFIDGKYFKKEEENWLDARLKLFQEIAHNIKGIYSLKGLDLSIFDAKRIAKLPYSFVGDGSICLPLDNTQFEEFFVNPLKTVGFRYVMNLIHIKNRGLLIRNQDLSEEILKENVAKFVETFK